ncbi:MAG: hypothetical protein JWO09_1830 [Bacteroidetes bacterium]|nr:hypothetical protein [Bacteroidota bacterium]
MNPYPTFSDVDLNDLSKDLHNIMYMLHHVNEDVFSKEEIKDACFSVKVALNSIEKMKEEKKE